MFLHLGDNVVIMRKEIIGIFNYESAIYSTETIQFIRMAEEDGFVMRITNEIPKSLILAEIDKKSKIFLSPISSGTLYKRIATDSYIEDSIIK